MATSNPAYEARRPNNRPDRPPPPPPKEEADVALIDAFDSSQQYTSPPSPPRGPAPTLPPPPANDEGEHLDDGNSAEHTGEAGENNGETTAAHLNPFHTTLPSSELTPPTILTPLRAHYLKKTLVNQQIAHELGLITDPVLGANALGLLGSPFVIPEAAKKDVVARGIDLPFLRYMFHQFFLPFPFLATAPPTFWSQKVQPFLSSFLATTGVAAHSTLSQEDQDIAESLMTKEERKEAEDRRKMWNKVEKHLGLMIGVGVKLASGEEVVRIGQSELRRIEEAQAARRRKWAEKHAHQETFTFDVNVVGVRVVSEKGRVRSKTHEEFIIRTQRTGHNDVFVSRRYGDFRRLAEELRVLFPDALLPNPPPKDKSSAAPPPPQAVPTGYSAYNPLRVIYGSSPAPSGTSTPARTDANGQPLPDVPPAPLSREKNRLTLRAYIQSILAMPEIANAPIMRSFLLSNPTALTPPEATDIQRRLEADAVREEGRRRFREEAERRVEALREGLAQFKGDILTKEGGLKSVFEIVRQVKLVEDLPPAEKSVMEWGRISLAATIFQIYVASDTASESLASLKRLHGIMPYFVLKGILRISNPMAMIRGVLDLFLARPFGGQSLLQKMFSQSLTEDVRYLAEDIQAVQDKIDDPVLCEKIEQYVSAPFDIQEIYRQDAVQENTDLLVVILRSPETPILSRPQIQRVARASRAYKEYKSWQADLSDSDDDEGPDNDDAWLFEDLNILMKLMMRKKEKEALVALIFEGVTAELLKDIITIFYSPLATVYKAASIADSLGDLQSFINDMIKTVDQVEELSAEDPARTVQTFIDLVQRHEQSFYTFVHNVHTKGQGLFDALMSWIELFLSYAQKGLPQQLDLEFLLPHSGPERVAILKEVDDVAQYHYKLKVAHEEKIRRRFQGSTGASGEEQSVEEAAFVNSVLQSLQLAETTVGAAGEIALEEEEENWDEDDEDDEDDTIDDTTSETSSIRSGSVIKRPPRGPSRGSATLAVPEDEKLRQKRSSGSLRTSLDMIRNAAKPRTGSNSSDTPPPVPPKDVKPQPPQHVKVKRHRKKRTNAVIPPPETPHIDALRSLFVAAVSGVVTADEDMY
ncbi:hypothetical protein VHUM_04027 [Vanrija humicola]|uniref:PX domain-containing protein n=1 Tax=Vanrija humicola TaxID=5417 RepID=A0A7D8Z045_VANHU|nr:hypothetical protein VHUM_04027 [Vanrija humicola]